MKFHINIEHKGKFFPLFLIGYTSDGGFFVSDIINDGKEYLIIMIPAAPENFKFGDKIIPIEQSKRWITKKSPKITHHIDGTINVSGPGITSGFYKFFKGRKGVSLQSTNLEKMNNDGGPIFAFFVKNLTFDIKIINPKKDILILEKEQIINQYSPPEDIDDYGFCLEFFYLPKTIAPSIDLRHGTLPFYHPNFGQVILKCIPAPSHTPGYICVLTNIISRKSKDNKLFLTLNSSPGDFLSLKENKRVAISIIYPYNRDNEKIKKGIKNIDYRGINKVKSALDSILYKIFKK